MSEVENKYTLQYPPVSVAMTTYNGERFLAEQIDSILLQTFQPKEIIICDDHSTDGTIKILEKYQQKNSIIKFYTNDHQLGVVNNFKKAVSLTSPGHYIALSDQDDIWLPEKIEKSICRLSEIDDGITPAIIYSDLIIIDEKNNIFNPSFRNELGHDKYEHCLNTLLFGTFVGGCTIMMNQKMKDFFPDIPDDQWFIHDNWISLIAFTFGKASSLPYPYIKYRKHQNNVSFSNYERKSWFRKMFNHIKSLLVKSNYLDDQIVLVKQFYSSYKNTLSETDKITINKFLQLENTSYIKRKLAFEQCFIDKWIKRF